MINNIPHEDLLNIYYEIEKYLEFLDDEIDKLKGELDE